MMRRLPGLGIGGTILLALLALASAASAQGDGGAFVVEAPYVGQVNGSYLDPEFSEGAAQVAFQDNEDRLWVGDLDPETGLFRSATGRDYLMDSNLPLVVRDPNRPERKYATNGPEWTQDREGAFVVYTRLDEAGLMQQWQARLVNGRSVTKQLTRASLDAYGNMPSRFDDGQAPRLAFTYDWPFARAKAAWIYVDRPDELHKLDGFDPYQMSMWSPVSADFLFVRRMPGAPVGQIARANADTGAVTVLTGDPGDYDDPGFFRAPEFGGETALLANVDNEHLAVYRDLGAPDGFWTRVVTLTLPADAPYRYLTSPEIIAPTTGLGGISYFAVLARQSAERNSPGSIWVFGLGTTPEQRITRRVDHAAATGARSVLLEPEPFVGAKEAYVYYNAYDLAGGTIGVRRARTGIAASGAVPGTPTPTAEPTATPTAKPTPTPTAGSSPASLYLPRADRSAATTASLGIAAVDDMRDDKRIGVSPNRYLDPEIAQGEDLMVCQDQAGDIWIAEIDPLTGDFVSGHGRDYRIDRDGASIVETRNGPEWGLDANGWSVFYSKLDPNGSKLIWRAQPPWNAPRRTRLTDPGVNAGGNVATLNRSALTTYLAQWRQFGSYYVGGYADVASPERFVRIPGVSAVNDPLPIAVRPVPGANQMLASSAAEGSVRQVVRVDLENAAMDTLTNDSVGKYDPWGFFAPEYGNELLVQSTINYEAIGVYRDVGAAYWQLIDTITMPEHAVHRKIRSAETFVANGTTWFVFEAFNEGESYFVESSIWVASLGTDPSNRVFRRLDDGIGEGVIRGDPEWYIGQDEVFVYYDYYDPATGERGLRRTRTGIAAPGVPQATSAPPSPTAATATVPPASPTATQSPPPTVPPGRARLHLPIALKGATFPEMPATPPTPVASPTPSAPGFAVEDLAFSPAEATMGDPEFMGVAITHPAGSLGDIPPRPTPAKAGVALGDWSRVAEASRLAPVSGRPGGTWRRPELIDQPHRVTYWDFNQPGNLRVAVAAIDPATGLLRSPAGRDVVVGEQVSPVTKDGKWWAHNGPEWGCDRSGWSVYYTKEDAAGTRQLWRARESGGDFEVRQATMRPGGAAGGLYTQRCEDPDLGLMYYAPDRDTVVWAAASAPDEIHELPGFRQLKSIPHWVPGTRWISYIRPVDGSGVPQLVVLDTETGALRQISDEPSDKYDAWGFHAPEFGGELLMMAVIDRRDLAIYRDLARDGQPWTRVATLALPAQSPHPYMYSVEPIAPETGVSGASWFSLSAMAEDTGRDLGNTGLKAKDGSIWVLGLGAAPSERPARRVDEGAESGIETARYEAESMIGTEEVFVYYERRSPQTGRSEVRRARTGIRVTE